MIKFDTEKKQNTAKLFIDETAKIIDEEGIEEVTIRKIAKRTNYNSATLYLYFDNLSQLISLACVKHLGLYSKELITYLKKSDDTLERFYLMWELFCKHCFEYPDVFYAIFTNDIGNMSNNLLEIYYSLYPLELGNHNDSVKSVLLETDFVKRNFYAMKPLIEDNLIKAEDANTLNEMIRLTYQGMLSLTINNRLDYSSDEATKRVVNYIKAITNSFLK